MDTRNVVAAISLSAAVIVLYSLFFLPDPQTNKQNLDEKKKIEQTIPNRIQFFDERPFNMYPLEKKSE